MKFNFRNSLCHGVILGFVLGMTPFAEGNVPDSVDRKKYHTLYEQARVDSDQKRENANQISEKIKTLEAEIQDFQDQIQSHNQSIQEGENETQGFYQDIQKRKTIIGELRSNIRSHQAEILVLEKDLEHGKKSLEATRSELTRQNQIYSDLLARREVLNRRIADLDSRFLENERRRAKKLEESARWSDEIDRLRLSRKAIKDRIEAVQVAIPQLEQEITRDEARVQRIDQKQREENREIKKLERQISQLESQEVSEAQKIAVYLDRIKQEKRSVAQAVEHQNQKKRQRDAASRQVTQAQSDVSTAKRNLSRLENEKSRLVSEKSQTEARIAKNAQNETDVRGKIQDSNQRQADLKSKIRKKEIQLTDLRSKPKSPEVKAAIEKTKRELSALKTKHSEAEARERRLKTKLRAIQANGKDEKRKLSRVSRKISTVDGEITSTESQVLESQKELKRLEKRLASHESAYQAAVAEVSKAQKKLDRAEQEAAGPKRKYDQIVSRLNQRRSEWAEKDSSIRELSRRRKEVASSIRFNRKKRADFEKELPLLRRDRRRVNRELATAESKIQVVLGEITQIETRMDEISRRRSRVVSDANYLDEQLKTQGEQVVRLQNEEAHWVEVIQQTEEHILSLKDQIQKGRQDISDHQIAIQQNQEQIDWLAQEKVRLESEVNQAQADLGVKERSLIQEQASFRVADQVAIQAEAETEKRWRKYNEVVAQYEKEFAQAKSRGEIQGARYGLSRGKVDGTQKGKLAGEQEGQTAGRQEGEWVGYRTGLENGRADGKKQGYEQGVQSSVAYQKGFQEGVPHGKTEAETFAQRTEYPRGRQERKAELLRAALRGHVDLENKNAIEGGEFLVLSELKSLPDGEEEILEEIDQVTEWIRKIQETNENARTQVPAPFSVVVDFSQAQCQLGFVDWVNACREGFKESYQAQYKTAYQQNYLDARNSAFDTSREKAFLASVQTREKEGYDRSYPVLFAKWNSKGALEAKSKGYLEGKQEGYDLRIASAKQEAYQRGVDDEGEFFQKNAVLRLSRVNGTAIGQKRSNAFFPGTRVAFHLDFANFGEVASVRGREVVEFQALTSNIVLESSSSYLTAIPARQSATVRSVIYARVHSRAKTGSRFRVVARLRAADGVAVERVFEGVVQQKIKVSPTFQFDQRPKVGGFFSGRKTHHIRVRLTNQSTGRLQQGFRVVLGTRVSGVKISTGEARSRVLQRGASEELELKYSIQEKSLKGKNVPLKVSGYYGQELLFEQVLTVRPR